MSTTEHHQLLIHFLGGPWAFHHMPTEWYVPDEIKFPRREAYLHQPAGYPEHRHWLHPCTIPACRYRKERIGDFDYYVFDRYEEPFDDEPTRDCQAVRTG